MNGADFYQTATNWAVGPLSENVRIFGHPPWFWERTGAVLQFVSAFVIVIDLLGPKRIRALAPKVRSQSHSRAGWRRAISSGKFIACAIVFVALATLFFSGAPFWKILTDSHPWTLARFVALCVMAVGMLLVMVGAGALGGLFGLAMLDHVTGKLLEATARLLENPGLERWIRVVSFLVFTIGFFMSMLAM